MTNVVTAFPQNVAPMKVTTFGQLIAVLPDSIIYPINVWATDDMANYRQEVNNLVFATDQIAVPSVEQRQYFDSLVKLLGIDATLTNGWHNNTAYPIQLYADGKLVVNKTDLSITVPLNPTSPAILTAAAVWSLLPPTAPFTDTIWATGSMVSLAQSGNDFDMCAGAGIFDADGNLTGFEPIDDIANYANIRDFFSNLLGWKTQVGHTVITQRDPLFYKLYENGQLCQQQ